MTHRRSTKKALFSSALALILCFSMLVGTTFAYTALTSVTIPASVETIGGGAFQGCTVLKSIYYGGTDENTWNALSYYANIRSEATVYYYSETQPTTAGNYWHYVNGVPSTVWDD